MNARIVATGARGRVYVPEQPSEMHDYTFVIEFDDVDEGAGNAERYEVAIEIQAGAPRPRESEQAAVAG